jgi:hypothetical protein
MIETLMKLAGLWAAFDDEESLAVQHNCGCRWRIYRSLVNHINGQRLSDDWADGVTGRCPKMLRLLQMMQLLGLDIDQIRPKNKDYQMSGPMGCLVEAFD